MMPILVIHKLNSPCKKCNCVTNYIFDMFYFRTNVSHKMHIGCCMNSTVYKIFSLAFTTNNFLIYHFRMKKKTNQTFQNQWMVWSSWQKTHLTSMYPVANILWSSMHHGVAIVRSWPPRGSNWPNHLRVIIPSVYQRWTVRSIVQSATSSILKVILLCSGLKMAKRWVYNICFYFIRNFKAQFLNYVYYIYYLCIVDMFYILVVYDLYIINSCRDSYEKLYLSFVSLMVLFGWEINFIIT